MIKCKNLVKILRLSSLNKLKLTKTGLIKTKVYNKIIILSKIDKFQT